MSQSMDDKAVISDTFKVHQDGCLRSSDAKREEQGAGDIWGLMTEHCGKGGQSGDACGSGGRQAGRKAEDCL